MDSIIIFCAKYLYLAVILIAGVYWLTLSKKLKIQLAIFGFVAGLIALALTKIGGSLFYDPRPFVSSNIIPLYAHSADNGFPSDHTVLTAFVAVTIFFASKKLGLVLLLLAIIIGTSRVMAHVHKPIDIIGSLVFAGIGGLTAYYLTPKIVSKL